MCPRSRRLQEKAYTRNPHVPILIFNGQALHLHALGPSSFEPVFLQQRVASQPVIVHGHPSEDRVVVEAGKGRGKGLLVREGREEGGREGWRR